MNSTELFLVKFLNGSTFKVFCQSRRQIIRFQYFTNSIKHKIESIESINKGIHTLKEFEALNKC